MVEIIKKSSDLILVKGSSIHNNGVFAKVFIPKKIKIIEYVGEKITKKETDRREELSKKSGKKEVYFFSLNKRYDIDGDVDYNLAKYINHSCDPNCEVEIIDNHIWIISIKDIQKGEELTYNYGFDIENYEDFPCKCGSAKCAGYILDESFWPKLKKILAKSSN